MQNVTRRDRLSFPFFFDPNFDAEIEPIVTATQPWRPTIALTAGTTRASMTSKAPTATILAKVSKVFPQLRRNVYPNDDTT